MKVLRTPDYRFDDLPGYDYPPCYLTITDDDGTELRVHYIDEGPRDADPILLMHGNPTWAYLYRKMIPGLLATGRRVLAVDLIGCGRSDKPARRSDYTQARHIDWMQKWLLALDLGNISLFCQDWGGVIGLNLVADNPERFDRVIASNTGIPTGDGGNRVLRTWQAVMKVLPLFPMRLGLRRSVLAADFGNAAYRAYLAPFPSPGYQAGIMSFPQLIAVYPDNPGVARNRAAVEKLKEFHKPFLTLFGDRDPVTRGYDRRLQALIPGAKGRNHTRIAGGGHFIQEDRPGELLREIIPFLAVR